MYVMSYEYLPNSNDYTDDIRVNGISMQSAHSSNHNEVTNLNIKQPDSFQYPVEHCQCIS